LFPRWQDSKINQKFLKDVLGPGQTAVFLHYLAEICTTLARLNSNSVTKRVEGGCIAEWSRVQRFGPQGRKRQK